MKAIRWAWLSLFVPPLLAAQPAATRSPERDIVVVVSAVPLSDSETVPGLLAGQRIMDDLRGVLDLVRGGVPEAASPGLESLLGELRRLSAGDGPAPPLPASYWSGGELWLPVRAQSLRVRLDAPDLLPRPRLGHGGEQVGNLPAKARRIDWLPVGRTALLVERARRWLYIGRPGPERAQRLLAAALRLPRSSLVLEDRPLILAYYSVESALAAAPRWDEAVRDRLRRAAKTLDAQGVNSDLAERLQAQADRLTPDLRGLQDLTLALRKQIVLAAGPRPAEGRP
jgi:hypothetical protein